MLVLTNTKKKYYLTADYYLINNKTSVGCNDSAIIISV